MNALITYEDYADEAESASRGNAWAQAAALYRRAADTCPDVDKAAAYTKRAHACDHEVAIEATLAAIARCVLAIPTRDERQSDRLDVREIPVHRVQEALRQAYRAGLNAPRP